MISDDFQFYSQKIVRDHGNPTSPRWMNPCGATSPFARVLSPLGLGDSVAQDPKLLTCDLLLVKGGRDVVV